MELRKEDCDSVIGIRSNKVWILMRKLKDTSVETRKDLILVSDLVDASTEFKTTYKSRKFINFKKLLLDSIK